MKRLFLVDLLALDQVREEAAPHLELVVGAALQLFRLQDDGGLDNVRLGR